MDRVFGRAWLDYLRDNTVTLRDDEGPKKEAYIYTPEPLRVERNWSAELRAIIAGGYPYTYDTAMAETAIILEACIEEGLMTTALAAVTLRAKLSRLLIERQEHDVNMNLEHMSDAALDRGLARLTQSLAGEAQGPDAGRKGPKGGGR
jgi:hypothetical protein